MEWVKRVSGTLDLRWIRHLGRVVMVILPAKLTSLPRRQVEDTELASTLDLSLSVRSKIVHADY